MAKSSAHTPREAFDQDRDFVAARPLKVYGESLGPGQPFDKTLVTTRQLRQLYESLMLKFAPLTSPVVAANGNGDSYPDENEVFRPVEPAPEIERNPWTPPEPSEPDQEPALDVTPRPAQGGLQRRRLTKVAPTA